MTVESELREQICFWGKSMFDRGLTGGSSGNLSARLDDGFLLTPTDSCLGYLEPEKLSKLDLAGHHISGGKPTKEVPLHLSYYQGRPQANGIVHLHSTYATALSCLNDIDPNNVLQPFTPYHLMKVGAVPLLPFTEPGTDEIVPLILQAAPAHSAILLSNHGPVVTANTFLSAVFAAEEFEEAAKINLILKNYEARTLDSDSIERLLRRS